MIAAPDAPMKPSMIERCTDVEIRQGRRVGILLANDSTDQVSLTGHEDVPHDSSL